MTSIEHITLEVADTAAAEDFYKTAWGLDSRVRLRASEEPTTGFRGFSISLIASQPATVRGLFDAAVAAGATPTRQVEKSMWGHGGAVRAPDGTIWKIATSAKKDTGPDTGTFDEMVLLLGVADVVASRKFYTDRGLKVNKSFGRKYVEFDTGTDPVNLVLYPRKAAAKDVGVDPAGGGSHRIAVGTDAEPFTDPDGFTWETA